MDLDDEAVRQRTAETEEGKDADAVREAATLDVEPEEREAAGVDDAQLSQPPEMPEKVDVSATGTLETPAFGSLSDLDGAAIGASSPADELAKTGGLGDDALVSSRLDPLGMLDASDVDTPTDREVEQALSRAGGGHIGTDEGPTDAPSPPGSGYGYVDDDGNFVETPADPNPPVETEGSGYVGWDDEGNMYESPADPNPPPDGGPDYIQPDPDAGYDVVTGENVEAALRTQGIDPYAQPTHDDDSSGAVTSANLDWAASGSDPRLTQYGPDAPQAAPSDATVAPPTDAVFDPPPDTAAVGMVGAAGSMADPGAALGGADVFGSSSPEGESNPPPTPGEDPGDDPWAPPPDDGGEG